MKLKTPRLIVAALSIQFVMGATLAHATVEMSCMDNNEKICENVTVTSKSANVSEDEAVKQFKSDCAGKNGTLVSNCSTTDTLGGCHITQSDATVTIVVAKRYYPGNSDADTTDAVKAQCSAFTNGQFFP